MRAREITLSISLLLAFVCCVYSEESIEAQDASSSSDLSATSVHQAKKRSAVVESPDRVSDGLLMDPSTAYLPMDDGSLDKRSSLFRFGKRQDKRQFRHEKRQGSLFRYGKRQGSLFRFGKRGSLFRFGKRNGGTLFRFGRSGGEPASYLSNGLEDDLEKQLALRELLAGYLAQKEGLLDSPNMDKREDLPGFHWGADE
ncbi:FMRFamide-related peptide 2 [Plakobranchus ocellatus]|uniref:FMRFamide-related peptide 2 n=1 Tax=Plakobranchus ocellatus TaxID=259542 RepID=A0AAV4BMU9_9GAST|nr:FMRFamide-related peptide 2 [Plakobranchus ocellatus]